MDQVKRTLPIAIAALLLGGCGNSADSVPGHTAAEDQALEAQKKLTPEQRIEQIKNSPLSDSAKKDMIDRIKAESGIK